MSKSLYFLFISLAAGALVLGGCSLTNGPTTVKTDGEENTNVSNEDADGDEYLEDEYYDEVDVVTKDAYGKDLEVVERYPDSLRSYYSSSEYETDVSYQTSADQEAVREFYNEKLLASGWEVSEDATDYMEFVRGDDDNPEIFTLYLTPYEDQGVLEYELVYEPALTEEQLKELEAEDSEEFDIEF